jgi:cell division protein FtsL
MKSARIPGHEAHGFAPVKKFMRDRMVPSGPGIGREVALDYEQAAPRRRRRITGLTTFNIVMLLVGFAVLVTVFISNVVAVDGLMVRQIELEREEQLLLLQRENLRAEINMLGSYNRVQKIAVEQLGLTHAPQQPYALTVYGLTPKEPLHTQD